jgi:hypothetical protein
MEYRKIKELYYEKFDGGRVIVVILKNIINNI